MKKIIVLLILSGVLVFVSCSNNQEQTPDQEALQSEIVQMENASDAIEASTESIDSTVADLDEALDALDTLFSE